MLKHLGESLAKYIRHHGIEEIHACVGKALRY